MPKQNDGSDEEEGGEDDVQERFEQVRRAADEVDLTQRGRIPEPPQVRFTPPGRKADAEAPRGLLTKAAQRSANISGMGVASTIGISLVVSIAVGAGLGWLVDTYLLRQETPWGLIVGFLLGTLSGFINLVRVANRLNRDS